MDKLKDLNELLEDIAFLKEKYDYLCNKDYEVDSILENAIDEVKEAIEYEEDVPDEKYYTQEDYELDHADRDWADR